MKSLMKFLAMAFVAITLTFVSCTDDPIVPPIVIPNVAPELTVSNSDMTMLGSSIRRTGVMTNTLMSFELVATDGNDNLQSISAQADGVNVVTDPPSDIVRIEFNGVTSGLDNDRKLLFDSDTTGFTKELILRTPENFDDSVTYTIIVRDVDQEEAAITVTFVTGMAPVLLTNRKTGVQFFNRAASSARPGALDLDAGTARASSGVTTTQLQDDGNNTSGAWKKTVTSENGVLEMRKAVSGTTVAGITTLRELLMAYDAASPSVTSTDPLVVGDVYIVYREDASAGSKYYAVEWTKVEDLQGSENDNYEVSIVQN